jgi:hypothetical protein
MLVVCAISFIINAGGINMETKADVEGKVVKEGNSKYIVDFREGLKKFRALNRQNYDKVLVDKNECVEE